jgi:tetratricopeptide (TPR) repeat protein
MRVIRFSLLLAAAAAYGQTDALVAGLEAFARADYRAAEMQLRQYVGRGDDPRGKAFLALTLAATSRCAEAEAELRHAFDTASGDVRRLAGLALAQCYASAARLDEAASVTALLKAAYPSDADVLYQAARVHSRAWNDVLLQIYQKNPSSFRVNQISGEILEMQGQFAQAAGEYRKAIAKEPKALHLHFRLGRVLLMGSNESATLEAAQREFEAELQLNPWDAVAEYQIGQILAVRQQTAEATARFERALQLDGAFVEALVALGKLRTAENRHSEAIPLFERAVKLNPRSESARYGLMLAYRNAGRMDDARREKAELDRLQQPPEGEFTEFLKKLGEKPADK